MCPSYMATRSEKDCTRGRANVLREVITHSKAPNPFDSDEILAVMDLCISCKGCKSECPSSVDVTKLKAEFLQHFYDARGIPLRARMVGQFAEISRFASRAPWAWNAIFRIPALRRVANRLVGFHPRRTIPLLGKTTLKAWFRSRHKSTRTRGRRVFLFCDEFTDYNDVGIGIAAVELLEGLGYEVTLPDHAESGRASLSKGLLRRARELAEKNVGLLHGVVTEQTPLVGIEPSALLCFRDEYPDLLRGELQERAKGLAKNALLIEEFLARELDAGRIDPNRFKGETTTVHLHGHCQQKAIASLEPVIHVLERLAGHRVVVIPSGCCGMAGSFGYEIEHYRLSQQIGELVLLPYARALHADDLIAAPGTSCRHQIRDGTARRALHPIEILRAAMRPRAARH